MSDQTKVKSLIRSSLSTKLLALTVLVILLAEIVIYLSSISNFRANWLEDRVSISSVAARVWSNNSETRIQQNMGDQLLDDAGALLIAYRLDDRRQILTHSNLELPEQVHSVDISQRRIFSLVVGAIDTLLNGKDRILRIEGTSNNTELDQLELVVREDPLRVEMLEFSRDVLLLSLMITITTSLLVYGLLHFLIVRPMRRITHNLVAYRNAPEDIRGIIGTSERGDEIGIAQNQLRQLETDLFSILHQKKHLADLGLAVAKINHDLRNTLSSAQLLSDQVADLNDPKVQRLAPKLVTTLDRAIGFCQSVLDHGRQRTTPPRLAMVNLHKLTDDAAFEAGLHQHLSIEFNNQIPTDLEICLDPDQIARVFANLFKNAVQALEASVCIEALENQSGSIVPHVNVQHFSNDTYSILHIIDNGPGLPPRAKEHLFKAFEGSARAGGSGLGLSIAKELVEAHGGRIDLIDSDLGTVFEIKLPTIQG